MLDCGNSAPWSSIIAGLDHVVNHVNKTRRPSVISMSLGGFFTGSVDDVLTSVINKGIPIVAAAGNDRDDACLKTPASNDGVITVGGSREGGGMYYYSNGGRCVDIIAPGQNVLGASHSCSTCTKYLTGTSMSTPLVSGVIAIHLQRQPLLTPAKIKLKLIDESCKNTLDFTSLVPHLRNTTPNRLLHINGKPFNYLVVT